MQLIVQTCAIETHLTNKSRCYFSINRAEKYPPNKLFINICSMGCSPSAGFSELSTVLTKIVET